MGGARDLGSGGGCGDFLGLFFSCSFVRGGGGCRREGLGCGLGGGLACGLVCDLGCGVASDLCKDTGCDSEERLDSAVAVGECACS